MCEAVEGSARASSPRAEVRRNYPRSGKDDGFMPPSRRRYRPAAYIGIEVEINQAIVVAAPAAGLNCERQSSPRCDLHSGSFEEDHANPRRM
jgi:hypothetical protein